MTDQETPFWDYIPKSLKLSLLALVNLSLLIGLSSVFLSWKSAHAYEQYINALLACSSVIGGSAILLFSVVLWKINARLYKRIGQSYTFRRGHPCEMDDRYFINQLTPLVSGGFALVFLLGPVLVSVLS